MPFNSDHDVADRLRNKAKLTAEEVRDLIPWMNQISETGMRRLNAELALQNLEAVEQFERNNSRLTAQNLEAVQQFERSSSRLTVWLIRLTVVLVVLTIVIAFYTVVLARGEHRNGESATGPKVTDFERFP